MDFASLLDRGLSYRDFLQTHGTEEQRRRWDAVHSEIVLSDAQRGLLASFKREMPVLCLAGAWCGDCVNQCPIFDHFSQATDTLRVLFYDRDAHPNLAAELKICGGSRVPVVVFLSEDAQEVGRYGDRTLSKYRQMAADALVSACPTGIGVPEQSLLAAVVQDWLNEFERAQLLLRLSPRLRQKHGD